MFVFFIIRIKKTYFFRDTIYTSNQEPYINAGTNRDKEKKSALILHLHLESGEFRLQSASNTLTHRPQALSHTMHIYKKKPPPSSLKYKTTIHSYNTRSLFKKHC